MARYVSSNLTTQCRECRHTFDEFEGCISSCCGHDLGRCKFIRYECPQCHYSGTHPLPEFFEKYPTYESYSEAKFG